MFVHEVMAAITTEPCRTTSSSWACATASSSASPVSPGSVSCRTGPPSATKRPTSTAFGSGSPLSSNAAMNESHTSGSGTRSCGRFGPATEGTTADRSSSSTSENVGSGSPSRRKSPCSFAYRSTRSTTASRPVNER